MDKLARQSGIIPYRLERDDLQVLLITTRGTGRWVIPKGNIGKGHSARQAAEREAFEEAGIRGDVQKEPLGSYTYGKALKDGTSRPTVVKVFAMHVLKEAKVWPEMAERRSEWMEPKRQRGASTKLDLRRCSCGWWNAIANLTFCRQTEAARRPIPPNRPPNSPYAAVARIRAATFATVARPHPLAC